MSLGLTIFAERLADLAKQAPACRVAPPARRRRIVAGVDPMLVEAYREGVDRVLRDVYRAGMDAALIAVAGNDAATLAIVRRRQELKL